MSFFFKPQPLKSYLFKYYTTFFKHLVNRMMLSCLFFNHFCSNNVLYPCRKASIWKQCVMVVRAAFSCFQNRMSGLSSQICLFYLQSVKSWLNLDHLFMNKAVYRSCLTKLELMFAYSGFPFQQVWCDIVFFVYISFWIVVPLHF